MKVLIAITLVFLCIPAMAADKCLKRSELASLYSSHMKYVENFGHVLAINVDDFDRELGYSIDIYAQKQVPVKDKLTKEVTHYKKCLSLVEKGIQGKYIYGSFSRSGVQIKQKGELRRVSFAGK